MITIEDIKALIAYAILNNRQGVIDALRRTGKNIQLNISDNDLFNQVWDTYSKTGLQGLKNLLNTVRIDKAKVNQQELILLSQKFSENPNAKFNFNQIGDFFGNLLGGHTTITQPTTNASQTTVPALSPTMVIAVAIIGIIAIIIIYRLA